MAVFSNPFVDEANALAKQLQQLAKAAAEAAAEQSHASCEIGQEDRQRPADVAHCAVGCDVSGFDVAALEDVEKALQGEEVTLAQLREQAEYWSHRHAEVNAGAHPHGTKDATAEAGDEQDDLSDFQKRLAVAEKSLTRWRTTQWIEGVLASSEESVHQQQLAEAVARVGGANEEVERARNADGSAVEAPGAASAEAEAARAAAATAELRQSALAEESGRLQDELDALRFQVKDTKRTQNRLLQELDSQVRRLEKQRSKLETESAARLKQREAELAAIVENASASAVKLRTLRDLNSRLSKDLNVVVAESRQREAAQDAVRMEHSEAIMSSERESAEMRGHQKLRNELRNTEDNLRMEAHQFQSRGRLLKWQLEQMEAKFQQESHSLSEAELECRTAREEEFSATRRCEILDWKMQVAKTHLSTPASPASSGGVGSARSGYISMRDGAGKAERMNGSSTATAMAGSRPLYSSLPERSESFSGGTSNALLDSLALERTQRDVTVEEHTACVTIVLQSMRGPDTDFRDTTHFNVTAERKRVVWVLGDASGESRSGCEKSEIRICLVPLSFL
eukprot:TRINITY_DN45406_c0_g1_i1.p1 TRINITY_DN45406_c0_g1~~TRINITY_DN45406_c0_g1_i1.p1  ORF type:complete len:569 (+),score=133.19 TRINITY_DN45406_c0_g1_i1:164-1870(+)